MFWNHISQALGQPTSNDCASIVIDGGKWQASDCNSPKPYVCEIFVQSNSSQKPQCKIGYDYYAP